MLKKARGGREQSIMTDQTKKILWVLGSLLVVGLLIFLGRPPKRGAELIYASRGQLVPGFSQELILDDNASVQKSYSVDYTKDNMVQKTANFTSNLSLADLAKKYKDYFQNNGWTTREDIYTKMEGIYATKGVETASLVIIDKNTLREVQVTNVEVLQ